MKKALAMALGAMLVAGSAAPAVAASQIDFSGYYRAYFMNDWNYSNFLSENKRNESSFYNRLHLDFGFHATDEVSVYWSLRAPSAQRWGGKSGQLDPGHSSDIGGAPGDRSAAETLYVYGQVVQDWGTVSIGRLSSNFGDLGLASLGWQPTAIDPAFGLMNPFDFSNNEMDGIRWANRWDNGFQLVGQFNRLASSGPVGANAWGDEQTSDLYTLEGAYFWDGGGASLGLSYLRDHAGFAEKLTSNAVYIRPDGTQIINFGDHTLELTGHNRGALKAFYINPAVSHSWGDFGVHFEGKFGWGKAEVAPVGFGVVPPDVNAIEDVNVRGYGLYLDFDYNYGPGRVNLAGWWTSGTGAKARVDAAGNIIMDSIGFDGANYNSLVDMGEFKPLLIAYGKELVGRNRSINNAVSLANQRSNPYGAGPNNMANHWAIDLNGRHAFNDDIALNWALAYLALNKTASIEGPGINVSASKSIGFEADLGLEVQLLDNLKFTTDFGYLFAGKALDGPTVDSVSLIHGNDRSSGDRYGWYNTLTFSF